MPGFHGHESDFRTAGKNVIDGDISGNIPEYFRFLPEPNGLVLALIRLKNKGLRTKGEQPKRCPEKKSKTAFHFHAVDIYMTYLRRPKTLDPQGSKRGAFMNTTKSDTDKKITVYLIEDEEDLQEALVYSLEQLGFKASGFSTAAEFYRAYAVSRCDIVVIDIELPDEDGFSIAQHLRSASNVGIVFATARGDLGDRVRGLRGGADAYFVKPVHVEELAASLEGIHRRIKASESGAGRALHHQQPTAPRGTGRWILKEGDWILHAPDGRSLRLTMSERAIVASLFKQRNKPVDRTQLATALGGDPEHFDLQRVDAVVSRLRRKATAAGMSLPLHAVRGTGYQFQA